MSNLLTADALLSLVSLSAMEIVLGIDNVVFISILTARLPAAQRQIASRLGMAMALAMRIALLFAITWLMSLTRPLFTIPLLREDLSGRDLILILGGLFLIFKATCEIHDKLEVDHTQARARTARRATFAWMLVQILLLDIVFSLDSVITAVGHGLTSFGS